LLFASFPATKNAYIRVAGHSTTDEPNPDQLFRIGSGRNALGWATQYISRLQAGETVSFRPRGASMKGKIESGQLCTVVPVDCSALLVGDFVLCKVRGNEHLHLIKAINGTRFQIGK
jgi:hypothetical protein